MAEKDYSNLLSCGHCTNYSKMEVIGYVSDDKSEYHEGYGPMNYGTTYKVLKCPACEKINIVTYDWHEDMESEVEVTYTVLFPINQNIPLGLPKEISQAYVAAEKVKSIDVNAYAILMRRLLEMVCLDRQAKNDTLFKMLKELATKGEIPAKLVDVAMGLKNFGNVGAHAGTGNLTKNEIPIVQDLTKAILEYVYSAPHLAKAAEEKLNQITSKS